MLYKLGLMNRPELNKVLLSLIYSWVEGRGKDREFKSLLILEDCIFLLEVYPSLYIWKLYLSLEVITSLEQKLLIISHIYCAWCIVVYWCNSYTIVHCSLDIIEWFKYKLEKVFDCFEEVEASSLATSFFSLYPRPVMSNGDLLRFRISFKVVDFFSNLVSVCDFSNSFLR
jgi:hypothetical protein